jgi:hypothetical protein
VVSKKVPFQPTLMGIRMSFSKHIDVTVGKALAMLEFVKRLSDEIVDPYTLEYASCVCGRLFMVCTSENSLDTRCDD